MEALVAVGQFLASHWDLVDLLIKALSGGASKDAIMKAVRAEMVAASDAEMKRELGV